MRHALRARARDAREEGFTLVEILVAMVLMSIIMGSLAVFFIGAQKTSSSLRQRQAATVIANDAMDHAHSISTDKLLWHRDKFSSDAMWAAPVVGVDLSTMSELYDTTSSPAPANNTGLVAYDKVNAPTGAPLQTGTQTKDWNGIAFKLGSTPATVTSYVGQCYIPDGGGTCTKTGTATSIPMYRIVIVVNWKVNSNECPAQTCAYVVGSLVSPTADPTFNVNQVILDTTPPTTPTNVGCSVPATAAAGGDIKVTGITWDVASDASGIGRYDVWEGTTSPYDSTSATWKKIASPTSNSSSVTDTGLIPSTKYYYVVLAVDTVGNTSAPQVPTGTVTVPQQPFMASCTTLPDTVNPVSPNALSAASTTSTVTLTWPAGSDDYQVQSYQIFRGGTLLQTVPASTLSYVDSGLSPWTNYTYQIKAVDVAGNVSTTTNPSVTIQTKDTVAPTKPVSINIAAKPWPALEIDLDWADSADDVAVTGYTVWRSATGASGPWTQVGTPATSSFADTSGLATSKQYWYYVTAHDAVPNTSTASSVVTASTPDTQPPTTPTGLTSPSKTGSTVTLSWTASTDNIAVTGYKIFRNGTQVGTSTTPSFTDSGLTDLTTYGYTVAAYDAAGNVSPQTGTLSVKTLDGTPPTAPSLSSSGHTYTAITLNWTAATDNVGVAGYYLYEDGGTSPIATLGASTYTYLDNGEAPGTTHTYTVKAFDAAGNVSAPSNTLSVSTNPDTTAPTQVVGLKGTSSAKRTAQLSWNASSDNVGVAGYGVYSNGSLVANLASPTVSWNYTGLANSTTYSIVVYAYDGAGNISIASATLSCVVNSSGNVTCT